MYLAVNNNKLYNVLDPLIGKDETLKVITVLNWPDKDASPPPYTSLSQHSRRFDSNSGHSDCLVEN